MDYAVVALDLDGVVTDWNDGARRTLGWTAEEMFGQKPDRFFTEEDCRAGIPAAEMSAALSAGRGNDERWHVRKGGERFWASGEMMPLRDEAGVARGFIKVLRDRTEQHQAAENNRADAEFLRSVLASSGDCIKVLDLDARLTFMSEGGMRVMEVSDFNAIAGCPWPDFWKDAGNVAALDAIKAARAGGVGHFQGLAETMAGTPKWWDVQVTPILGPDGRPDKLLVVSRDMTEAHETRERLDLALDAGTIAGTWVWDILSDRLRADYRFARTFGLEPDDVHQGVALDLITEKIHPDDCPIVAREMRKVVAEGGRFATEFRIRPSGASWVWVEGNGHCAADASGQPSRCSGVIVDVDGRKRNELRREVLLDLGESLRHLRDTDDSTAMVYAAAETMGRTLEASHAGWGYIDEAQDRLTINRDWYADASVLSVATHHSLASYGSYAEQLKQGEVVSISNVTLDPRTRSTAAQLLNVGVHAFLNVPLMESGRFVALLFLNSATARA